MKKFALLLSFVFAAGLAAAQEPAKPETKPADATKTAATAEKASPAKTHELQAEVVSVDATAKTITIKGDMENKTVPVEGKATAQLKTVKAGDKVTLSCRDNDKGEHQAVVAIKAPTKAPAAEKKN